MVAAAPALDKPQDPVVAWLRKMVNGWARQLPLLAQRRTPRNGGGMRAGDLLCSPNAHTGPIIFLERRCASKRALGDQPALPLKKTRASLEGALKAVLAWVRRTSRRAQGWEGEKVRAVGDQSSPAPKLERASLEGLSNGDHNDRATHPPQVAATNHPHPYESKSEQAWTEHF